MELYKSRGPNVHLEKTRVQYRKGCDRNEVQGAVGAGEGAHGASQPVFIVRTMSYANAQQKFFWLQSVQDSLVSRSWNGAVLYKEPVESSRKIQLKSAGRSLVMAPEGNTRGASEIKQTQTMCLGAGGVRHVKEEDRVGHDPLLLRTLYSTGYTVKYTTVQGNRGLLMKHSNPFATSSKQSTLDFVPSWYSSRTRSIRVCKRYVESAHRFVKPKNGELLGVPAAVPSGSMAVTMPQNEYTELHTEGETEVLKVIQTGKRKKKALKRMVTKVCFFGDGFTQKPPKYEKFIRPMGLCVKKAHVTHPELKATFCLPVLGVKENPSSPLYATLGVITKGTVLEVNMKTEEILTFLYTSMLGDSSATPLLVCP
ncbi:hypothetical protein GH733_010905 [Mirounga leonina]|nr:hypothetical protein GH733_010905 [Mirounga leonina]